MSNEPLSTEPYKGVRDFYPEDMAVQRYIFATWSKTAESFGYSRYDASILEPAELYKSKGAENEEMINEQTYTFTDRGDREVTLRPEMTPTVARMIAARARTLRFPVRWYSIPNLFRYERPQRGRLREHWQLNCDIFGATDSSADTEIIALAHQLLIDFGATQDMFEIRVNNRQTMRTAYEMLGITDPETVTAITRVNDRKHKLPATEYLNKLTEVVNDAALAEEIVRMIEAPDAGDNTVVTQLRELGIENVRIDRSLARGFDYYTGTIFELFDTADTNNRSMLGGGRYDNLTALFGGEAISGIGFGMGDVTMRDFLETHNLLPETIRNTASTAVIIPTDESMHVPGYALARDIRADGIAVSVDIGRKRFQKKLADAAEKGAQYAIVLGADEVAHETYTIKKLTDGTTTSGTLTELLAYLADERRGHTT